MLTVSDGGERQGAGRLTRRDFLEVGALGALGLTLPDFLAAQRGASCSERACILIFNVGGPSHLDTFDMKPEAPAEIRGPFRPIRTRVPGLLISELLPRHARIADKFSLVRSCYHRGPAVHDAGWQMLQTGRLFTGGVCTPHAGAVRAYLQPPRSDLPPHVVLPETMGRGGGNLPHGQAGGFLGPRYDPFTPAVDADETLSTSHSAHSRKIGRVTLDGSQRLRSAVEQVLRRFEADADSTTGDRALEDAYRSLASPAARAAFDLDDEPRRVRERYGHGRFGQSCLLARRLVERGVPFVTINTFLTVFDEPSWDVHGRAPFSTMQQMKDSVAPPYDRAYSALVEDLDQRGLLPTTLVCNLCEFGRTPRVNAAGGRDHWPQCFTVYFAGGGVVGGRVVGRSDPIGGEPVERAIAPPAIVATIFRSLGLDPTTELPGPDGRPYPLVDAGHEAIEELFG